VTLEEARAELGISSRATSIDVRRAFKKLALRHHPDRNGQFPDAAARFRRIVVAYEILSGQRPPSPAVSQTAAPAAPRQPDKRAPWEIPFAEALPLETADGEPIHFPTADEIRKLDIAETHPGKMMNRLALIFVGVVVLWAILAALGPTLPAEHDPVRDRLRESLSRPW
jgi:hypothetical protein